jgi:hypothetical protein
MYPGGYQETPVTSDGPDVLDGGDVVEGVGVIGLASGPSSVMGCFVYPFVHNPLTTEYPVCCRGTWSFHRLSGLGYLLPERQVLKD